MTMVILLMLGVVGWISAGHTLTEQKYKDRCNVTMGHHYQRDFIFHDIMGI